MTQVAGEIQTLVNDAANSTIDLVLSASAPVIQWNGNVNGNWDINVTANWQTNGIGGFDYTQPGGTGRDRSALSRGHLRSGDPAF